MKKYIRKVVVKKRSNTPTKKAAFQLISLAIALCLTLALTLPSFAEGDSTATSTDTSLITGTDTTIESTDRLNQILQVQNVTDTATSCADPTNSEGLGAAQQNAYKDRLTMIGAVTNTDKLFDIASSGGCFNALKNFPNLSVAIPSLSSIADALAKTILNYATRKVCNAVNDALTEAIGPINTALEKVSKSGQLDLTGQFNSKVSSTLYSIDPQLGAVAQSATSSYSLNVDSKDVTNALETAVTSTGTGSGTTTTSSTSTSSGTTTTSSTNSAAATSSNSTSTTSSTLSSAVSAVSGFFGS